MKSTVFKIIQFIYNIYRDIQNWKFLKENNVTISDVIYSEIDSFKNR